MSPILQAQPCECSYPDPDDRFWITGPGYLLEADHGGFALARPCGGCHPIEFEAYNNGDLHQGYFLDRDGRGRRSKEDVRRRNIDKAKEKWDL